MKQRLNFSRWLILATTAALLLSACGGQATPTSTPAATESKTTSPVVSASGEVLPAQWTTLSFSQAGTLGELTVKEGDMLKAGDVIARLDVPDLHSQLAQKQASIKVAEANLAQLTAAPQPDVIEAATQAVKAAQARVAEATAQRDRLFSGVTQADILQAQAQVYAAQVQKDKIQEAMDKILKAGGFALAAGESVGNRLAYANLELAAAQAVLADLQDGPQPDLLRLANARIGVAQAQVKAAEARLALTQAGPPAEDVVVSKAKIDQARAEAALIQAQIDQAQIVAPFDGTVARVLIDTHQFVGPGVPIVQVADLTSLRVETSDLNENDVARIKIGDPATVRFDALPDVTVNGSIVRIDPKARDSAGVNYTTVIQLDQIPDGVRWGMTANVEIAAGVPETKSVERVKDAISATGKALPAQKTALSFALPGQVIEVRVDVGATVKSGDVIARLDTAVLDAEVAKAQAGLAVAQAALARIKAGPRAEQVAEAQSQLAAAQSGVGQAAANRDQVKQGPTTVEIEAAKTAAQAAYNAMIEARNRRDLLDRDRELGKATRTQVDDATKIYNIAYQSYEAAQARVDKLLKGADADVLRAAQAGVSAAQAEYEAAQAQVNRLLAGATAADIAVGEANVAVAQAGLDRAKATRQQAEIVAPFDGVIADAPIRTGQYVNAGTPLVVIGAAPLHIETTDLSEKDVAGIAIGSKAQVSFDALPGVKVDGTVSQIAPKSSKTTGVNYTVTIDLRQIPDGLRWGMTALVEVAR
ncbi:MAG: HlyD family efflux transporter periplasmic adaptor subunit [Thermoflexales bacterium]|nr:HlyD family efflux transporter periplasmic adaptor subunit [Thermoflexales bacterium]